MATAAASVREPKSRLLMYFVLAFSFSWACWWCSSALSAREHACLFEHRKGGEDNVTEKFGGAVRLLLASSIVQCCEAVEGGLARWRKGPVAARRKGA